MSASVRIYKEFATKNTHMGVWGGATKGRTARLSDGLRARTNHFVQRFVADSGGMNVSAAPAARLDIQAFAFENHLHKNSFQAPSIQ